MVLGLTLNIILRFVNIVGWPKVHSFSLNGLLTDHCIISNLESLQMILLSACVFGVLDICFYSLLNLGI